MPAKPGKERSLLTRFLKVYEQRRWADASLDWVDERVDGAVELVATRADDDATLAIEHTVIQPHPREKEDLARFSRSSFGKNDRDPSIEIPQAFLFVNVPIDTLQRGQDWDADAEAVRECIRRNKHLIPEGLSELQCVVAGNQIALQLELVRDESQPDNGHTIIARYGPFDVPGTVRSALEKKLPKLVGTDAQKRLLMFERDQWQLSNQTIAAHIEDLRDDFPLLASIDEVWIAETHENRNIVLFEPLVKGRRYAPVYIFNREMLLRSTPGY